MDNKQYISAMVKIMKSLMNYDENMKLTKYMILRIQGLPAGKTVANNHAQRQANYSYETIILTFQYFKSEIDRVLANVNFVDDQHKFNTIFSIVDKHLNDTYMIIKRKKEMEQKSQASNVDALVHKQVEYKSKTVEKPNEKKNELQKELEGLW